MVIVMVTLIAGYALSRLTASREDRDTSRSRLEAAMTAIDAFAAQTQRLPCPALPTATAVNEEGLEVRNGNGCTHGEGVLPWQTLGLPKDAGYDGWGRRLSYRVHFGTQAGFATTSLTQDRGASVVPCDTWPITGSSLDANGLCNADRDTDPATYLALNRLRLTEKRNVTNVASVRNDMAYVVLSHGATGFGGYTVSGARLEMPKNDELENTRNTASGFFIRPFSDVETKANANDHFDDLVGHRTIGDLIKRANLTARDWPETTVPADARRFDQATVNAAVGPFAGTNTGTAVIDFGNVLAVGGQGSDFRNISFDTIGGVGGIGVTGSSSPKMTYLESEFMFLIFDASTRRFAMTLNDFGTFPQSGTTMTERVLLVFYQGSTIVHSVVKNACRPDGGLASFEIDVPANFNGMLLAPAPSTGSSGGTTVEGDTGFLISEVRSCAVSSPTQAFCRTTLSSAQNTCTPDLRVTKTTTSAFVEGQQATYEIVVENTGIAATSGTVTVVDTLPIRLSFVSAAGPGWTCSASGLVVTCTRAAVIPAGERADPITLTVAVGTGAAPSVTNVVAVSGGGEASSFAGNNSASLDTPVSP